MFSFERLRFLVRLAKILACVLIAALLVWRGNVYRDPAHPGSMLPSVMCALLALFLLLTGMAMGWQDEAEPTEAAETE